MKDNPKGGYFYMVSGKFESEHIDQYGNNVHNYSAVFRDSSFGKSVWKTMEHGEMVLYKRKHRR